MPFAAYTVLRNMAFNLVWRTNPLAAPPPLLPPAFLNVCWRCSVAEEAAFSSNSTSDVP